MFCYIWLDRHSSPCHLKLKQTIDAVIASGLRDQVKIMVGGAPVTQAFADDIGADVFASDAGSAAKRAKALVN